MVRLDSPMRIKAKVHEVVAQPKEGENSPTPFYNNIYEEKVGGSTSGFNVIKLFFCVLYAPAK
jgi:hypothetical protein